MSNTNTTIKTTISKLSIAPIDNYQYDTTPTTHNDFDRLIKNNLENLSPETDRFVRQSIEAIYSQIMKYSTIILISIATNRKYNLEKYLSLLFDETDYSSDDTFQTINDTNRPIDEMITVLGTVNTQRKVDKEAISNALNAVETIRQAIKDKLSDNLHIKTNNKPSALTTKYEAEKPTTTKSIENEYVHADILLKIANLHISGKSKEALAKYTNHVQSNIQTPQNLQGEIDFVLDLLKQDKDSAKAITTIRKAYSRLHDNTSKEKNILIAKQNMIKAANLLSQGKTDEALKAYESCIEFDKKAGNPDMLTEIIEKAKSDKSPWLSSFVKLSSLYVANKFLTSKKARETATTYEQRTKLTEKIESKKETKKSMWANVASTFYLFKKAILPEKNTTNKTISEKFNSLSFRNILSSFGWKKQKTPTTPIRSEPYITEKPITNPAQSIAKKQDETPKTTSLVVKFKTPSKIDESNIPTLIDIVQIQPPRQLKASIM